MPSAFAALLFLLPLTGARAADPYASDWAGDGHAQMRLIAAGRNGTTAIDAAVQIELEPGALTYWRQPGDAGVPPVFSFGGSVNAAVTVGFPAPSRLDEAGLEAFGYRNGVVFPLTVTPADPAKPVIVDVKLAYAVCKKVCIPAEGHVRLALDPAAGGPYREAIDAARRQMPVRLVASDAAKKFALAALRSETASVPSWRLTAAAGPMPADVFVEGPEGWFFETRHADGGFSITAVEKPKAAAIAVPVTITTTGPDGNLEYSTTLPLAAP